MYDRAVEQTTARLRDLRHEEWEDLGLAAVALGLAVASTRIRPTLAVPLLVGGIAVGVLAMRASGGWALLDRLVLDRDA